MQTRRKGGCTVIEMLVTLVFVVLICGIIFDHETRYEYCRVCGKKRTRQSWAVFRQPLRWTSAEKPSEFSKLYAEFVSASCTHRWRSYSSGWVGLLGGGVRCDTRYRRIFREPQMLRPLRRLRDKNKIKTVIASCDVPNSSWPGDKAPDAKGKKAFTAFDELRTVSTQQQEDAWWRKNRHLFVKK